MFWTSPSALTEVRCLFRTTPDVSHMGETQKPEVTRRNAALPAAAQL